MLSCLSVTYNFSATVLQSFPVYWTNIFTANVQIVLVNQAPITTTSTTTTTTTTTTVLPEIDGIDVYQGCAVTKTCFGFPDGCTATRNCISFGSITFREERFIYELQSSSISLISYWEIKNNINKVLNF